MKEELGSKNKIIGGLFWTFCERFLAQLVSTVVAIILARILAPEDYGIIATVTIFITISNVFVTSGFGTAIVQKKDVDENDYNSAFIVSFLLSLVMYVVLYLISPMASTFFEITELCSVLRVMALRLPLASINTIQQANVQRNMQFKKFFLATSCGTVASGVIGIWMAHYGFGVWALVGQYLTNTLFNTVILFIIGKWIPKISFSVKRAKDIFSFGWKILLTDLVYTVETEIRSLVIGKVFGSEELAFFDEGRKYPALIVQNVNASINKVMLPAYSQKQDNLVELKGMLRKSIQIGMFIMAPMLVGFAAVSDTFVYCILTEKWAQCIPFIKLFSISYLTRPLESSCNQALIGIGKNSVVLKIMVVINVVDLLLILFVVFWTKNVLFVAVVTLVTSFVSLMCFLHQTKRHINYKTKEQLKDLLPTILVAVVMGVISYSVGLFEIALGIKLVLQITSGIIAYFGLAMVFKIKGFDYFINLLKRVKK